MKTASNFGNAGKSANNDNSLLKEDDEKEFEPTVEMMMNEFDDEQTIEEEEELGQDDAQEEISALEKEQDMPIEELLKLYYNKPPEGDEQTNNGENPQQPEEQDESEVKAGESETTGSLSEDPSQTVSTRGEKRTMATPPPAKKSKSELAKFYTSAVEGRSLRSSAGNPGEVEEEEESEEEIEEGKDYSWKKTIMIGPSYQASVPHGLTDYDNDTLPYENEDKQLWDPSRLTEDSTLQYLSKSSEAMAFGGGVNAIPNGSHIRDDEQALFLLLQCGYNVDEAFRRRRMNAVPPADTMSLWSEEECRAFETGLRVYGKDFYSIKNQKVGTRAVGELVQFYYLWKKTERHDVFANSFRMEKKKYTLHPGTTDYMERFIDEQESGRERSTSPNYHSLIYGDTKKTCEDKSDIGAGKEDDLSTERSTE
jgi:hypothetical protein